MTRTEAERIIRQVAGMENVSEGEVRAEMEKAIMEGYMNGRGRQRWDELFGPGVLPDVEDFIIVMSGEVINKKDNVLPS